MSKMSQLHARLSEMAPATPDDTDWDSPATPQPGFAIRDRVQCYLPSGNYCRGWVESIEPKRIGVRLVNGNFRWAKIDDVKPERYGGGYADDFAGEANR